MPRLSCGKGAPPSGRAVRQLALRPQLSAVVTMNQPGRRHKSPPPPHSRQRNGLMRRCGCGRAGEATARVVNKVICEFKAVVPGSRPPGFAGAVMAAFWGNCFQEKIGGAGKVLDLGTRKRLAPLRYALTRKSSGTVGYRLLLRWYGLLGANKWASRDAGIKANL